METTGTKVYFTVMIYLHEGREAMFDRYEDIVLPLLAKYGGTLLSRVRSVKHEAEAPQEIHILSFDTHEGLDQYRNDPIRQQHALLYSQSVLRTVLFECEKLLA